MKTSLRFGASLCALFFASSMSIFAQGGSLTPPPGPPGPTMKTLDQIQPRRPIESLPYTISTPGSYYLTKNLTAPASSDGITVSASNVTIDLNGFTLAGGGGGGTAGIKQSSTQTNFCIRNGTITGWTEWGVYAVGVSGGLYEKLRLIGNTNAIGLLVGAGSLIHDCVAYGNFYGISTGDGCTVLDCTSSSNAGVGFNLFNQNTIVNCTASNNQGLYGINALENCSIIHCNASGQSTSGSYGIHTSFGCTVADCTVGGNDTGIYVDYASTVRGCTVRSSFASGIAFNNSCQIVGNTCDSNNRALNANCASIFTSGQMSRIEGNSSTFNGYGIRSAGSRNLIIRNSASGNTPGDYAYSTGDAVGPIVNMLSGGTISSTNPWANFTY